MEREQGRKEDVKEFEEIRWGRGLSWLSGRLCRGLVLCVWHVLRDR